MGTAAVEAVLAVTTTARSPLAVAAVTISVTATLATMGMSITMSIGSSAHSQYTALSVTKSYNSSCYYFRSPKLNSKMEVGKVNKMMEKTRLRKTNS